MARLLVALAIAPAISAFVQPSSAGGAKTQMNFGVSDLEKLAEEQNPIVGYFNPLSLGEQADWWDQSEEASIGWLRHAEIKHGRVAMAGFVGYCLHANGVQFPAHIPGEYTTRSPGELWDQVPYEGKLQILGFIAFLEFFGELGTRTNPGAPHYMRGGVPGTYPSFKKYLNGVFPHPVPLDLYDPAGLFKNASPEKKARGRLIEINNGRLAMIGLFGFLAESKVPGSVPALGNIALPYDGDYMAPFAADFHIL